MITGALRGLGVDARVGEVPGEYCPGAYSVNARGAAKLAGIGQRMIRGGAHLGGVVVASGGGEIADVLRPVYRALELDWDPATSGSVTDELGREVTPMRSRRPSSRSSRSATSWSAPSSTRRPSRRSSSTELKTSFAPASRSSASENPPVSTASVSDPARFPASRPKPCRRSGSRRDRRRRRAADLRERRLDQVGFGLRLLDVWTRWSTRRRSPVRRAGRGSAPPPTPSRSWPAPPGAQSRRSSISSRDPPIVLTSPISSR